jgi:DNA-binding protein HU-beta
MNKAELTQHIAKETELTIRETNQVIDTMTEAIKKALKKGQRVSLVGFGSWEVKKRAARNGINPQTGQTIKISARKYPKFNPGKALKEIVEKTKVAEKTKAVAKPKAAAKAKAKK